MESDEYTIDTRDKLDIILDNQNKIMDNQRKILDTLGVLSNRIRDSQTTIGWYPQGDNTFPIAWDTKTATSIHIPCQCNECKNRS